MPAVGLDATNRAGSLDREGARDELLVKEVCLVVERGLMRVGGRWIAKVILLCKDVSDMLHERCAAWGDRNCCPC